MNDVTTLVEQHRPIENNPLAIIANAVEKGMDADQLAKLVDLHERIEKMNAGRAYQEAMKACQSEMPRILKDRENPHARSKYADLGNLISQIEPIYTKHGFSISFYEGESNKPEWMRVMCDIMHERGHREVKWLDLPYDGRGSQGGKSSMNAVQAVGSTKSYGRRYLLGDIFNLAITSEDTDGHLPSGNGNGSNGHTPTQTSLPACPACKQTSSVIVGKEEYGGGFVCFKKKNGCGHKWHPDHPAAPESEPDMALLNEWKARLHIFDQLPANSDFGTLLNEMLVEFCAIPGQHKQRAAIWKLLNTSAIKRGYERPHKVNQFIIKREPGSEG